MNLLQLPLILLNIFFKFLTVPLIESSSHLFLFFLRRFPDLLWLVNDLFVKLLYFLFVLLDLSLQFLHLYL